MRQKKILALLFERSEQAIDALNASYGGLCLALARDLLGSDEDAKEVVNDTFLAVWEQIPPDQPDSLVGYMTRILRRKALNRREYDHAAKRDVRMNVCLSELEEILPGGLDPEKALDAQILRQTIHRFLGSLNMQNRQIFLRRYFRNQSAAQIAKEFGMKESAVRVRLMRLREQLRAELEKEGIPV